MDGQLRLKSEEGKGSRFVIQLRFVLPDEGSGEEHDKARFMRLAALTPTPPAAAEGEVTLVDKISSHRSDPISRKRSIEEVASLHSFKSGSSNKSNKSTKSDVDRLIDAISGPLAVGEPESEEQSLHRSNSKTSGHSRKSAGSIGTASSARLAMTTERPGGLTRSKSYGAPEHLRSAFEGPPGSEYVTDNKTLLKAIRIPDEFTPTEESLPHTASRVLFDIPDKKSKPVPEEPRPQDAEHLKILVAEDDPINSKIILKRLEKSGHEVRHTVNGEECASAYGEAPESYDVVLMDMQMVRQTLPLFREFLGVAIGFRSQFNEFILTF